MISIKMSAKISLNMIRQNAAQLGINLMFILLWISAFGIFDRVLEWTMIKEKYQIILFVGLFVACFIFFLFINSNGEAM